jgi:hypothetical protein
MSPRGSNFVKRLIYLAREYNRLQYVGVFVVSTGSLLYLSQKYASTPTLLASEKQKRKKIVVLGTGWAAVNFLKYVPSANIVLLDTYAPRGSK